MSRKHKNNGNGNGNGQVYKQTNKEFKPKTRGQEEYVRGIIESDITFCTGPAGSGKTACAVGIACEHLLKDKVKNIVITRPVLESGRQGLGFLPGDMYAKIHPYLIPILDEMYIYLGKYNTENKMQNGMISVAPLEYMRGRNFHNSFIIIDEAQNATLSQLKMALTRIGRNSTVVVTGDISQSDLYDDQNGLKICIEKLDGVRGVSIIQLCDADIIRNGIISRILAKL